MPNTTSNPAPTLSGGDPRTYETFYRCGGWRYDIAAEDTFVRTVLIPAAGWRPGDRVIEIGAGRCLHANLIRAAGMDVTATDVSAAGTTAARQEYPLLDVHCADAATWTTDRPGHVYARGLSWYHYELDGVNSRGVDVPACTAHVFANLVAPGCVFAMQIATDLSGTRDPSPTGAVHHNTADDYADLFAKFGPTRILDWSGRPVKAGRRHDRGVLVVTVRPESTHEGQR
jgi:hypothetical protein